MKIFYVVFHYFIIFPNIIRGISQIIVNYSGFWISVINLTKWQNYKCWKFIEINFRSNRSPNKIFSWLDIDRFPIEIKNEITYFIICCKGPFINYVDKQGGGGFAKCLWYYISLVNLYTEGRGGSKILKIMST